MNRLAVKTVGVGVLVLALGVVGGAAVAAVPALFAPANVSGGDIETTPMPAPTYGVNTRGESFGSSADARTPAEEPDLIRAEARNGKVGYVRRTELEAADGTAAMKTFGSPDDALAWQRKNAGADVSIPVYLEDGVTVIGDFLVTADLPGQ
ncbi:hypothetical protein WDU99_14300 [Microbacterium sp. Mu-80]|uniref:Uncharacterized protein n=1 Tax=Microbacterium bandirmense TaxID=3122050 RepID=A0ABU8LDU1_9MICO